MKPSQLGIALENLSEMNIAATALEFVGDNNFSMPETSSDLISTLAVVLRSACHIGEGAATLPELPHAEERIIRLNVPIQDQAAVITGALAVTAQSHPDDLVRQSAEEMIRGHQQAIFDGAMNTPPAEA